MGTDTRSTNLSYQIITCHNHQTHKMEPQNKPMPSAASAPRHGLSLSITTKLNDKHVLPEIHNYPDPDPDPYPDPALKPYQSVFGKRPVVPTQLLLHIDLTQCRCRSRFTASIKVVVATKPIPSSRFYPFVSDERLSFRDPNALDADHDAHLDNGSALQEERRHAVCHGQVKVMMSSRFF